MEISKILDLNCIYYPSKAPIITRFESAENKALIENAYPTAKPDQKKKKEKKKHNIRPEGVVPKEKKPQVEAAPLPVDISRLYMKVGKITACEKHPDADALYLETIECGEGKFIITY